MLKFLFSPEGRIGRGGFWLGALCHIAGVMLVIGACMFFVQILPDSDDPEGFNRDDAVVIGNVLIIAAASLLAVCSSLCIGIKRFHDRDKDGAWVLIQFVPVIGGIWYLIEAGFLSGTVGSNRFGPDPRDQPGR